MTEIPENIKEAAYEAMRHVDDSGALGVISKAILAERERCWFIVKEKSEGDMDFAAFLIMKGDE